MIRDKNLFGGGSYGRTEGSRGSHDYSSVPIGEHDDEEEEDHRLVLSDSKCN